MPRLLVCLIKIICCTPLIINAQEFQIMLEPFADDYDSPVDIAHANDERLFIVEKRGIIRIIDTTGQKTAVPFLDIDARVNSGSGERGLLGLVFHPNYAENRQFYVNYTDLDGSTTISRFLRDTNDINLADPASEKILLNIPQPFANHNAGDLAFGPDGYLYIGTGDGGSAGDPGNRAQDPLNLLGKMLRIDVDSGDPYSIPPDNPFAEDDFTLDEIWALGLRNPWRYSFDRMTGDLYIADVGQNDFEEVDVQPAGSPGGQNYGWRCYEGESAFNLGSCPDMESLIFPVFVYPHIGSACSGSITGGFVYRGIRFPEMQGTYFFTDFCTGVFRSFELDQGGNPSDMRELMNDTNQEYTSFGEDALGELYLTGASGTIYRLLQSPVSSTRETAKDQFTAYPNPATDRLYIKNTSTQEIDLSLDITVYNILGNKQLIQQNIAESIDVTSLIPGTYFVRLEDENTSILLKFLVTR